MKCPYCGNMNNDSDRFCRNCGQKLISKPENNNDRTTLYPGRSTTTYTQPAKPAQKSSKLKFIIYPLCFALALGAGLGAGYIARKMLNKDSDSTVEDNEKKKDQDNQSTNKKESDSLYLSGTYLLDENAYVYESPDDSSDIVTSFYKGKLVTFTDIIEDDDNIWGQINDHEYMYILKDGTELCTSSTVASDIGDINDQIQECYIQKVGGLSFYDEANHIIYFKQYIEDNNSRNGIFALDCSNNTISNIGLTSTDAYGLYLDEDQEYIYYVHGGRNEICRYNLNKGKVEDVTTERTAFQLHLFGNTLYYVSSDGGNGYHLMKKDVNSSSDGSQVFDASIYDPIFVDDHLYYINLSTNHIEIYDLNSNTVTKTYDNIQTNAYAFGDIENLGSVIYYANTADSGKIYKYENGQTSKVVDTPAYNFFMEGDLLYYINYSNGNICVYDTVNYANKVVVDKKVQGFSMNDQYMFIINCTSTNPNRYDTIIYDLSTKEYISYES